MKRLLLLTVVLFGCLSFATAQRTLLKQTKKTTSTSFVSKVPLRTQAEAQQIKDRKIAEKKAHASNQSASIPGKQQPEVILPQSTKNGN